MVSGRSVKCNAIFAVYDLSALGFETLLFGMFSRRGGWQRPLILPLFGFP